MHFTPPPSPPPAIYRIYAFKKQIVDGQLIVKSHGYSYFLTGNTLLPRQLLSKALQSTDTPQAAIDKLRQTYLKAGYFLVAVRAREELGKKVRVEIIEGQVTQEKVSKGMSWFFPGFSFKPNIRRQDMVYRSILASEYAQRNGDNLQIGFAPSTNPGGSTLIINTTPTANYSPLTGNVFFGNYGSRYSSRYLTGGSVTYTPGLGLALSINGSQGLPSLNKSSRGSEFSTGQIALSSITPWGIYGFNSQWTHYRIGQVAYPLNPTGNVFTWGLTGSQLIYANSSLRLSLNEGYTHVSNEVKVYQDLIPGGYPLTTQHYNYFSVGTQGSYAYSLFNRPGSLVGTFIYNQGTSANKGTLSASGAGVPNARFHYFDASLAVNQSLLWGLTASLNANGQGAFNTLPQQQQWVLGGFGNLSAWYPGILSGDSGYSARFKIESPSVYYHKFAFNTNLFFETGGSQFVYAPKGPSWQSLSDVGVGVGIKSPWGTQISAISAIPVGWNDVSASVRRTDRVDAFFVISQQF
ncbi:ShlB/FhaC/HecB family hemolysin secretion/activation protein [Acidithiobacillus thiooxidans]|uniref:ShlB/FhaC/HecB family hemolysin secretion/activation protein n=1 Tax=Acidithiobacillus thiooxidans TaxID=930 RepID=UPI0002625441|nr:ShlB/FhaC/HecB family hemolysin secretion/activation protein [Acidithiobacillus thiooxidans]MBU2810442.1 ShlB/FhaC/HecB family hemolysin secretion/activation protein [Acidithiobacillus thiooxidans]